MKQRTWTKDNASLLAVIFLGLAAIVGMSRWHDARKGEVNVRPDEEALYLRGSTVKRLSLSFNGLAADLYWMRTLQYVGNKILSLPDGVQIENLSQLDLKLLVPLLETTTTLDPQFMAPYHYAAALLPEINVQEAIRIINKGIGANPTAWRLHHNLGYIYWQQRDFAAAAEAYARGAELPGAPAWMAAMKARMLDQGGSRETAREIFTRMYAEADDQLVKEMARLRLLQLDSLDERDALRNLLTTYKLRAGRCPETWREIENLLRALKVRTDSLTAPLDPSGTAYLLIAGKCEVALDPRSEVPSR